MRYHKLKKIGLHLLVWGIILSVNLSLFGGYFGHDYDMYRLFFYINGPIWLVYLALFYSNYIVFIPKLLFSGSTGAYLFCSMTTLCLSYVIIQEFKYSSTVDELQRGLPLITQRKKGPSQQNIAKKDSMIISTYGKSPLLSSVAAKRRNQVKPVKLSKSETILIEEVYHRVGTKRQIYGDIVYFLNEDTGVRSFRRPHNSNIYSIQNPRNITQIYLLLLIFTSSLVVGAIEKSIQRSRDLERISREKMSSELSYLKQQINPHFLFNALNSIYSLVLPHSEPASDAVIKLSSILRYMLYETDKKQVSLEKEMEVIRDYLDLQKLKFSEITKVTLVIEGDLRGHTIEPLLLMTFIENAYKYGADNITPSFIDINVSVDEHYFTMSVRNKIVIHESNADSSGIGIKNIIRRLDLIYQDDYQLDIKQENGIFSVKVKLKLL